MQASSRDDFIIAIRSAFIKKENKQKFSLFALIILTLVIITLGKFNFKIVDYLKVSLKEVAYRSSFVVSIPENLVVKMYNSTKKHFPALGKATISGVLVTADEKTGLALKIQQIILGGALQERF